MELLIYVIFEAINPKSMKINKKVKLTEKKMGVFGFLSVVTLVTAILIFGHLNSDFSFWEDYVSKLGAKGEPNALLFNLIGFVVVGV